MAVGQPSRDRREDRGRHRPRSDQQAGLDHRGAEHVVEVEGQGDESDALGDKAAHRGRHRQREDRPAEQIDRQQRHRLADLPPQQQPADRDRADEFADHRGGSLAVPDAVDAADQRAEHHRGERSAPQIEAMLARRGVGQTAHRQQKGHDADRHVDREQPRPRPDREDRRRDARPGRRRHRDHQRGHRDTAAQLPARIGEAHQRGGDAHHPGRTEPLQGPPEGQHFERSGQCADQRRAGIDHQPDAVDPAIAENVAERGEGQQRDHHRELIGVDHPDRIGGAGVQILSDRRQRDIDDRGIEARHRQPDHQGQDRPIALRLRKTVFRGVHLSCRQVAIEGGSTSGADIVHRSIGCHRRCRNAPIRKLADWIPSPPLRTRRERGG
jgi:hypothetical protein